MSYYLLNHVSTEVLILLVVGVPTLIAVLAVYYVDKRFPRLRDIEIGDTVHEVVGLLFGLLLRSSSRASSRSRTTPRARRPRNRRGPRAQPQNAVSSRATPTGSS